MTLRHKTLLIVGAMFLSLIVILYFVSQRILINGFTELEEENTSQNVERALSALNNELAGLKAYNLDWASWDDSYTFVQNGNSDYIKANLVDSTFIHLRLNIIAYVNSSGQTVFAKAFDLNSEEEILLPQSIKERLSADSPLVKHADGESAISGIIVLPEKPMLIVSQPILTSNHEGPIRGALIMGRYLDTAEVKKLSEVTHLSLTISGTTFPALPDFKDAVVALQERRVFVRPLDGQTVAGYTQLRDINGKPGLILRADMPRDIYQQGRSNVNYLVFATTMVAFEFGIVTILILERQVLSRLFRLDKSVGTIGVKGSSSRVLVEGKDELAHLATTINDMLSVLQQSGDKLRESEIFSSSLLQNAPNPVLVANPDTSIRYVNPALEELTGFSSAELVGIKTPYPWWLPEEQQNYDAHYKKAIAEENLLKIERVFQKKSGEQFWVEVISINVKSSNPTQYHVSNWVNITERKKAAEELQQLYKLEKQLRQELEGEIARRIEFTRALVHELKTPITPVLASSELLVDELKDETMLRLAKNVNTGATELNKRIDELLDLAKGEIGMLSLSSKIVDPMELLQEVISNMTPLAVGRGLTLRSNLPSSLPAVQADEDRLRQVLLNLIGNATKFTQAGGEITVIARQDSDNLVIEIKDSGVGIDEEEQKRLFQPYHRLVADREHLSGLGLGLALSKKLVELHGGKIWVSSRKGAGSTFAFSLPMKGIAPADSA